MSDVLTDRELETLMRATWPDRRCRELGRLLERSAGGSDRRALRSELSAHLSACPPCGSHPELAESMVLGAADSRADAADLEWLGSELDARLERQLAGRAATAPTRSRLRSAVRLLAAAVVLAAIGLGLRDLRAPEMPARAAGGSERGGLERVRVEYPLGPLEALPEELRWEHLAGAASYAVRLTRPDGHTLWSAELDAPPARLPGSLRDQMRPATRYVWSVTAHATDGDRVGASEPSSFIVAVGD